MVEAVLAGVVGPVGAFVEGLAGALAEQGYSADTVAQHVRLLAHLGRWLGGEGLDLGEVTEDVVQRFIAVRRELGYADRRSARGLAPLLGYLRRVGAVPEPVPVVVVTPIEEVIDAYVGHLVQECGLAPVTVRHRVFYARLFLGTVEPPACSDLGDLAAGDVTDFVLTQCRARSVGWARNLVTALRSLLRFLLLDGRIVRDLTGAVLAVAGWRSNGGLPKAFPPGDVSRLLGTCDRDRRAGTRDLAILTVLVRLGLRSHEVAALELGDIDWRAGEIVIRGKGGRRDRLPLPVDVGEVIVDYLCRGRPACDSRGVFITAVAPRIGISTKTIGGIVRSACERAGLPPAGAHRLRHTAATEMLRDGASLREIGEVLRHTTTVTTAIYAKVDVIALGALARPWPGMGIEP